MEITTITAPGSVTLSDLEQSINGEEPALGPVVDLGNDGLHTLVTFNESASPPGAGIVLRTTRGGQTPVVPGFTLVCQGNCIVFGQMMGVAAFRSGRNGAAGPAVDPASAMAQALTSELPAALQFKPLIDAAAAAAGFAPSLVAGIGSVESAWGTSALMRPKGPTGTGDATPRARPNPNRPGRSMPTDGKGFGRGLLQIDWDAHEFARTGNWQDPQANIEFGVGVLAAARDGVRGKIGAIDLLAATCLAYNAGVSGALRSIAATGAEAATAPSSYPFRVLKRAAFYRANGFG